jgi:hypothetical protein
MHKQALLAYCDTVLACKACTGTTRMFWQMLRDKVQPSLGSIFR